MVKSRYLHAALQTFCFSSHKLAFLSGPRQCGKTTWSKSLLSARGLGKYLNWDEKNFRKAWTKDPGLALLDDLDLSRKLVPLVIVDEIHKAKGWKRDLKGIFDTLIKPVDIVVTGSAKLDVYRRGSDSLMGRYHHFRLHPFSLSELLNGKHSVESEDLITHLFEHDIQFSPKKMI
jgi:predicted AAA+ superfamily ATPase